MNLAGQLVINKARFGQIGAKLKGFSAIKSTPIQSLQHNAGLRDWLLEWRRCFGSPDHRPRPTNCG